MPLRQYAATCYLAEDLQQCFVSQLNREDPPVARCLCASLRHPYIHVTNHSYAKLPQRLSCHLQVTCRKATTLHFYSLFLGSKLLSLTHTRGAEGRSIHGGYQNSLGSLPPLPNSLITGSKAFPLILWVPNQQRHYLPYAPGLVLGSSHPADTTARLRLDLFCLVLQMATCLRRPGSFD